MDSPLWFFFVGILLLAMGLTVPLIKRLPVTSAIIYLVAGMIVGPMGLGLFHFNPLKESGLFEILTEIAVLISLFSAGVKMPVPFFYPRWRNPVRLAFLSMTLSVGLVTLFGQHILGLPVGAAVLLGAVLAPTDPVLATDVQARHPGDQDRLRFTLTCEAGMNDGSAFPFVMLGLGLLGLHELGNAGVRWLVLDMAWATLAAVVIGAGLGIALANVINSVRGAREGEDLLDDFLGLGLIGTVYGVSLMFSAWGFLAVFAAAVALRQTELKIAGAAEDSGQQLQEDTDDAGEQHSMHHVSEASLVFKEHLERLSELVLILLIGGTLFLDSWSWRSLGLALFLFIVARPLSVLIGLLGTRTPWRIQGLVAWFGVRGIGSLYYLMFAIQHGLPEKIALELIHLTLIVVALSIFIHGISVKPLIIRYWIRGRSTQA